MCFLQNVLRKLDHSTAGYSKIRTEVNAWDERIKEIVWGFEDILESHVVDQILPQLESSESFFVDLQPLQQNVSIFVKIVKMLEGAYFAELANMPEEEGEPVSSRIDFGGINSKMVGLSDQFEQVRDRLIKGEEDRLLVTGMAGVGKTTLVKKVFDDPSIQRHFDLRAWVKIGRKWEGNDTLRCILAQVDPNTDHQMLTHGDYDDEETLFRRLEGILKSKKCLIVLDDVWDTRFMRYLLDNLSQKNVRILFTSRINNKASPFHKVRLLNKEESEKLLGEEVFGEEGFPPYLQEVGEKIAKKCEGLPLMIVEVAKLLTEANRSTREELNMSIQEYWTKVAEKQHNPVFEDAYDQISEVFFPSYEYLPQFLKMVFLYLGAYPPYCNINLEYDLFPINAEGFVDKIDNLREHEVGNQTMHVFTCLVELADAYHLLLLDFDRVSWFSKQDFRVHSCWQHLCKKEASKIKFLHVLQSCYEVMEDQRQRRLCVHSSTLLAIKEVYDSIKRDSPSTIRSLLCYGPGHPYPVPIHAMDFKLLRVLNALKVRFYHIPSEILKLVCLKYLALTCNKDLPVSISNLLHLQFLRILPYVHIIKRGALAYMPMEIWDMQNLQFLDVFGRDLPTPNSNSNAILDKVFFISGVSTKSCTTEIFKRIPNLQHLLLMRMRKPYDEDDDSDSLSGLANISGELHNLSSLQFAVFYPDMKWATLVPLSMFPSSLNGLTLSGLGCPWQNMNDIGSMLPNLITLKLEHYAFQGPEWDLDLRCFLKLEILVIEDTDLVQWRAQHGSLPRLKLLSIRHCYKLRHLDWMRDSSMVTQRKATIELIDCNPLVYESAARLPESLFAFRIHRSY
ncbi:putative late blight resistance protein homolog R1A-4 [Salvia hispanica]|uniref:putative late blight resistance protein homolog R1A-4 n=1 Tax=Salvia hispanica TaxID=49212 RepID=UPI002009739F|nr:putative late blight resistance protein homolog R1A-4 [Salvia hispanica]